MNSFEKKEKWKRLKSKGKKSYVLKSLFFYEVFVLLITTVYMLVFDRTILTNIPKVIFTYLCSIIILSPVGVWGGKNSWNANMRRFEK